MARPVLTLALIVAALLGLLALVSWRVALALVAGSVLAWAVMRLARPQKGDVVPMAIDADTRPRPDDQNKVSTTVSKR